MGSKEGEPSRSCSLAVWEAGKLCHQSKVENFYYVNFSLTNPLLAPGFTVPLTGGGFFRF